MTRSPDHEPTSAAPIVETTAGAVRGIWRDASAAFLGIPFAEPPVGELRFAAPRPHAAWDGVRDATEYGATPQRSALAEVTLIPEPSIPGDSTLNVNVFTPSPAHVEGTGLPVLVYIHGGGFVAGSPASPWYDGAAFNRDGVVTVSVSYRLGFEGFGWIDGAPHNRGVLDWILALEWVRDNIAAFGGDPARVTIAGQSAGGGAVLTLLGMPSAQQLFHRVHSISGAVADVPLADAEALARRLAEAGGVEPTVDGFSSLSEDAVLALQGQVTAFGGDGSDPVAAIAGLVNSGLTLGPVVDGELLPASTLESIRAGVGAGKQLLLGATDNEFNMALAGARPALVDLDPAQLLVGIGVDAAVASAYAASRAELDPAGVLGQYVTDSVFRVGVLRVAAARGDAPTWIYRFSWKSPTFGESVHCVDMPFYFDCLGDPHVAVIAGAEPSQQLADDVHGAAVAFIADGDPGWQAISASNTPTKVFDTPSSLVDDGYADVRLLLGDGVAV